MFNCPVCSTEYLEPVPDICHVCGWAIDLNSPSNLSESEQEKELLRVIWAKKMWQKLNLNSLSKNGHRAPHKPVAKKSQFIVTESEESEAKILKKLTELQHQLNQSAIERQTQQSMLALMQSQINWLIYRFDQLNTPLINHPIGDQITPVAAQNNDQVAQGPLSEVGIDYYGLMNLMSKGKWRKADEQTWEIILRITAREDEGWLRPEDIANFPCTDLQTIDRLWEYYSNGLFGLSVQLQIWQSLESDYGEFCDLIGWRDGESWKYYDEISFDLTAPSGHLPIIFWRKRACYGVGQNTPLETFNHFTNRLWECQY